MGALRVTVRQLPHSNRPRCNGGGALGAQMNLFDRFARVIKVIMTFMFCLSCGTNGFILLSVMQLNCLFILLRAVLRKCNY